MTFLAAGLAHNNLAFAQSAAGPTARPGLESDVEFINKSKPSLCAEHDNVQIDFKSSSIKQFEIQARHPAYIANITKERAGYDLAACGFQSDAFVPAKPRKKTFWESRDFWLTGYTFEGFWRPNDVSVRVGKTVEHGFHMVQLWMLHRERAEEILVFYPPDGYWRARPLPFEDMRWTAYGSSFMLGPVEMQQRPLVRLKEISFEPKTRTFTLHFLKGGTATLTLKSVDQNQMTLSASFQQSLPEGLPFASLRSMYVTENNSDVARLAWRRLSGKTWHEKPVLDVNTGLTNNLWAGRRTPSRHNLSAPDFIFKRFLADIHP